MILLSWFWQLKTLAKIQSFSQCAIWSRTSCLETKFWKKLRLMLKWETLNRVPSWTPAKKILAITSNSLTDASMKQWDLTLQHPWQTSTLSRKTWNLMVLNGPRDLVYYSTFGAFIMTRMCGNSTISSFQKDLTLNTSCSRHHLEKIDLNAHSYHSAMDLASVLAITLPNWSFQSWLWTWSINLILRTLTNLWMTKIHGLLLLLCRAALLQSRSELHKSDQS